MTHLATGRRSWARPLPVIALIAGLWLAIGQVPFANAAATPTPDAPTSPQDIVAWDGSVDLYRKGTFTTQQSWLWCTAAGVQIVRNIVERDEDHSTRSQRTYFDWMRGHNKYALPESAGVDPAGWTAGLRHFVDDRYRLVASKSFDSALRSAARSLRLTQLPVAITVANGGHGWIMTGFSATADPIVDGDFKVTSVRVVGPLFGLQSKNGYDMKPGTSLTTRELRRFLTPWRYEPKAMVWDGRYVTIQPVPAKAATLRTQTPAPSKTAPPPVAGASFAPSASSAVQVPATPEMSLGQVAVGAGGGAGSPGPSLVDPSPRERESTGAPVGAVLSVIGLVVLGLSVLAMVWRRTLRSRAP